MKKIKTECISGGKWNRNKILLSFLSLQSKISQFHSLTSKITISPVNLLLLTEQDTLYNINIKAKKYIQNKGDLIRMFIESYQ